MKLLFDQNISFKVSKTIQDIFPGSKHLSDLRLENYSDIELWQYAKANDYGIVTFDYDFIDISTLKGFPPKILLFKTGNTPTLVIIEKLKANQTQIEDFLKDNELAVLEIK